MSRDERHLAIQRRGRWTKLQDAIALFKATDDDPKTGAYAQALADVAALEVEMRAAGQEA